MKYLTRRSLRFSNRNFFATYALIALLALSFLSYFAGVHVYGLQDQGTVYVVSVGTNSLLAIQGDDVVANISVGSEPFGVAVDGSNNLVFVTNYMGNSISVIKGFSNMVVNTFTGLNGPTGVFCANLLSPLLYVAEYEGNDVAVVNPSTGSVLSRIGVGSGPEYLAFNPINNELYVSNSNNNTVSAISLWSNTVVKTIIVGNGPRDIVFDPADQSVYVANEYNRSLSVIDWKNDVKTIELPKNAAPWSLTYNYFDSTLYAGDANFNGKVFEVANNNTVFGKFSLGPFDILAGAAFDPLTNIVYFTDFQHGNLYLVSDNKLVQTVKLGFDQELFSIAVSIFP